MKDEDKSVYRVLVTKLSQVSAISFGVSFFDGNDTAAAIGIYLLVAAILIAWRKRYEFRVHSRIHNSDSELNLLFL